MFQNFEVSKFLGIKESIFKGKIDQKASDYYRNMPKAIFVAIGDDIDDSWNSSD
jgi:hypothetical protein